MYFLMKAMLYISLGVACARDSLAFEPILFTLHLPTSFTKKMPYSHILNYMLPWVAK